jgi:hypothetical protein
MNGVDVLRFQLLGSCSLVADAAQDSAGVWRERLSPGVALPGFVVWHCARIVDWGVNTVVRGAPELGAAPKWSQRIAYDVGHGAGLTDAGADEVATTVHADDLRAYALELRSSITEWLDVLRDADLDAVPELRARNEAHARYATPEAWEEIKSLEGVPAWQVLARPCVSHVRMHMGELELLTQQLQASALSRPS